MPASSNVFDFVVVGVGSMGSSACFHLARRGYKVLGLERFSVFHEHGAHSGHTRLIRKAYFEHPDYVPLLERAYLLWDELGASTGLSVFERTGILYAGPEGHPVLGGIERAADTHRITLTDVTADAVLRFPQFSLPEGSKALFEPDAGFLRTEEAILGHLSLARGLGAVVLEGEGVVGWSAVGGGVEVRTEKEVYRAAKVVITAGPWAAQFVPGIAGRLTVTLQTAAWFGASEPSGFRQGDFPCWGMVDSSAPGLFYGFPWKASGSAAEPEGIKAAHHTPGPPAEPDAVRGMRPSEQGGCLAGFVGRVIPLASASPLAVKTCLYANSPDGDFVIDNLPGLENHACVAWGFSGHGFKFASVVGEVLADLAEKGMTELPIGFLNARRFDE